MQFPNALVRATLIRRYKRFLADAELEGGEVITASCPNTGSMKGLTEPGSTVWLSESDNPKRKYRHTWEMIEADLGAGPHLVGINTGHPNRLVTEGIENGVITELQGYGTLRREQKYGKNSRIDILLEDDAHPRCYVEVKNVHLMRAPGKAEFPDSVTARGTKHLGELADMVREGHRAVMLFLVQRADAGTFELARDIDPAYGEAFEAARAIGVEALAYACELTPDRIDVTRRIEIVD